MLCRRRLLFGLWLVVTLVGPAHSGLWRRRRRGCGARNCAWHNWSAWGACTHPCGNAGVQVRTRSVRVSAYCGGAPCSGGSTSSQACNRFCHNGGTPRPGYCTCPGVFWNTCCGHRCAKIRNCDRLVCSSGTDEACQRCQFDYGGEKRAYKLARNICEKVCSWRSDSLFCYPGACPDVPSSCRCAPGFGSTNCLTINTKPSIVYCVVKVLGSNGTSRGTAQFPCETDTRKIVYTNLLLDTVTLELKSTFKGPSFRDYPIKYYIKDFNVGIVGAKYIITLKRGGNILSNRTVDCSGIYSRSNPHTGVCTCAKQTSPHRSPLQHADRILFKASVTNGGYVKINNFDSSSVGTVAAPKFYSGQTTERSLHLVIDAVKPVHCSIDSTCSDNMLDRGPPITKSPNLTVKWVGWKDGTAGIQQYELTLYKMAAYGEKLSHRPKNLLDYVTVDSKKNTFNTIIRDPGVYAVLLAAVDKAGNWRTARRFFIFDDTSVISTNADKQLRVNSVAGNIANVWVTSLQNYNDIGEQVNVTWHGHFTNVFQHAHKFLTGIGPNSPPIDAGYEELTGQPPNTVSREAIPNVNAIVRFDLSFAVDHLGGRSLNSPGRWTKVDAFQSETMTVDIPRADGDSVRVWVRAADVMGNTNTDSVLVHVDSSPPVIQDVRFTQQNETQTADFLHVGIEVDSYDFHSGLASINWQLFGEGKLYDSGQVAASRHMGPTTDCVALRCYCIPKDSECFLRNSEIKPDMAKLLQANDEYIVNYDLVLNATNNAMLSTPCTYKFKLSPRQKVVETTNEASGNDADQPPVRTSITMPLVAGGSILGVVIIGIMAVSICCLVRKKSRNRDTHGGAERAETNKDVDTGTTDQYMSLQFNNPGKVDDESPEAIYETVNTL